MKPSVGRIVHYVSHGTPPRPDGSQAFKSECRAAIVTEVDPRDPGVVGLCVLNPTGQFFNRDVTQDEGDENDQGRWGGTWHWPEREPSDASPQVHVNADLSPQQVKRVTEMVQAAILQQAKRGRTTGFKLPGRD